MILLNACAVIVYLSALDDDMLLLGVVRRALMLAAIAGLCQLSHDPTLAIYRVK